MRYFILTIIGFIFCLSASAQVDSTGIVLPEVPVKSALPAIFERPIQPHHNSNITEVLSRHPVGLHIRNSGPGTLSTLSLMGHSAAQTRISINDFSITSTMNGVYDLSLLPVSLVESVIVNSPSDASNGDIGGNINLETQDYIRQYNNLEIGVSSGSFGEWGALGKWGHYWDKERKFSSIIKFNFRQTQNDFSYTDLSTANREERKLENGDFRNLSLTQFNRYRINDNHSIYTNLWWMDNERGIPPTAVQTTSISRQQDALLHFDAGWNYFNSKEFSNKLQIRYAKEDIVFDSGLIPAESRSHRWEIRNGINKYWDGEKHELNVRLAHEFSRAEVDDYQGNLAERNLSTTHLKYTWRYLGYSNIKAGIKTEILDGKVLVPHYNIKIDQRFDEVQDYRFFASFSRNYRIPTFNDLYWGSSSFASGNPDLDTETSHFLEGGFIVNIDEGRHDAQFKGNYFYSNVKDWILWFPNDAGIWTPENIRQVISSGFQLSASYDYRYDKHYFQLLSNYQFNQAINKEVAPNAINSLEKQLIYTPRHSGGFQALYSFGNWDFIYNNNIVGKRYTTSDNSNSLPTYLVSDIGIFYEWKTKKEGLIIKPSFEIKNIFNSEYTVIENRPMPPINFLGSIHFSFDYKSKTK